MTMALSLLCRVVRRRVANGEKLTDVLKDYPRLTESEKKQVTAACK